MTDLEITRLCAVAMGYDETSDLTSGGIWLEHDAGIATRIYNPLHDDAQAMALVKKLRLTIITERNNYLWMVGPSPHMYMYEAANENLNLAICLCVARMQQAKEPK